MISSNSLSYQSWVILFTVGLLIFLMNIDYTAVNLALVPISEDIEGDLNTMQWLLSGYILIWGAFMIPGGRLADLHGKTKVLVAGLLLFMVGSIVVGAGDSVLILIIGRILQGLGAALFSAPAYSLIFMAVPAHKQGMAMGVMGGATGLGLALGPTLAGWIIKEMSWRWIFYINVPLCILMILVILLYTPQEKVPSTSEKVNWGSVSLLVFGLGSFMFALNQIEVWGMGDLRLWGIGAIGLCSLAVFGILDRRQNLRMLPPVLLKNKPFMSAIVVGFVMSYGFSVVLVMMGLYLQNTLNLSTIEAGEIFLAMTLAIGILSPLGGKLADHMDMRISLGIGFIFTIVSFVMLSFLDAHSTLWVVGVGLFISGLGLGILMPVSDTAMFRTLVAKEINTGSALFTMALLLGNSFGVIVSTSVLVMVGRVELIDLVTKAGYALLPHQKETLVNIIAKVEHTPSQLQGFTNDQIPHLLTLIDQAFLYGFRSTLWIGVVLSILTIGVVIKYLGDLRVKAKL